MKKRGEKSVLPKSKGLVVEARQSSLECLLDLAPRWSYLCMLSASSSQYQWHLVDFWENYWKKTMKFYEHSAHKNAPGKRKWVAKYFKTSKQNGHIYLFHASEGKLHQRLILFQWPLPHEDKMSCVCRIMIQSGATIIIFKWPCLHECVPMSKWRRWFSLSIETTMNPLPMTKTPWMSMCSNEEKLLSLRQQCIISRWPYPHVGLLFLWRKMI